MMTVKRQFWVNLVVFLSLMLLPLWDASAQEDPFQVFFTPDPATIYVDEANAKVVTVDLANAVNIWSFDVIITYDSAVAIITDYAITDRFGSVWCAIQTNQPGFFQAACASTGVPVNGDGNLFTLTFTGVGNGKTALTFDRANFGNTESVRVPVVSYNGELNVVGVINLLYLPLIANTEDSG
jgi:hypothetical protein